MSVSAAPAMVSRAPRWLALRFAWREIRGGLRGFYVFIACIALGVTAIAGIGSVAESLTRGLAREGRVILGGDAAVSLIQREASAAERAFLESRGRRLGRDDDAGDGARGRRAHRADRDQGGRRRLSAVRPGGARAAAAARGRFGRT